VNTTFDTAQHSSNSARRRAYRASRQERLSFYRSSLWRSKVYRFCGWLFLLGLPLAGLGLAGNLFPADTAFDVLSMIGIFVGPAAMFIATVVASVTMLVVIPAYEYIRQEQWLRTSAQNCAMCIMGVAHN
jgi:hypothetical protein